MLKFISLLVVVFGATSQSFADSYVNFGVSMNTVEADIESTAAFTTNHDDGSNTAYFDFGYFLTDNLAAEIGYRSAEHTERYSFSGLGLEGDSDVSVLKVGLKAFTSSTDSLYGFGGLGLAMMDVEGTITDGTASSALDVGDTIEDDSNNVYFTVGAGYRFTESLSGEVAYADYGKAGAKDNSSPISEQKYSEFSLGISYNF